MASRKIETNLIIKAVDQYSGRLRAMNNVTGRFASKVRADMRGLQGIRGPLRLIEDFRKTQAKANDTSRSLSNARERVRSLKQQITSTRQPSAALRREFDSARRSVTRLEQSHQKNRQSLQGLRDQLRDAKVNTSDLAGEQRRLAGALDSSATAFGRQIDRMRRLGDMQDRIARARERMDRSLARAANLSFVGGASQQTGRRILTGLANPVSQAIEFESAMSDVRKVLDFDSPDGFRQMSNDVLQLSTRIPIAASGLAEIVAAGGQSGFAREDLLQFAEMAAKIGVAFDISAGQSGTSMANIRTALQLSLDETGLLFDAMNHLSNNMASTAPKVLDFINRTGAAGASFGFDPTETLAIGSAMIAAGAQADVAATSFRRVGGALVKGTAATKAQREAFAELGLDAVEVAKAMQEDAEGTLLMVFERLNEVPEHARAATITQLFGEEARAIMPLIGNLDLLREALGLVSEEEQFRGSAEAEYAERAKTTANNIQLMRNQLSRLGVAIGEVVLPHVNALLEKSQAIVEKFTQWTKAHPKLTKWLLLGGAAIGAMAVAGGVLLTAAAGLIGTLAVLRFGLFGLGARALFAGGEIAGLLSGIKRAGRSGGGLSRLGVGLAAFSGARAGGIRAVGGALRALAGVTGLRIVAIGLSAIVGAVGAISLPIWLGVAGVVATFGAAWKFWDRISAIARGVSSAIGERLQPVLERLKPVLEFLSPSLETVKSAFSGIGSVISDVVSAIREFFSGELFSREILTEEEKANLEASAADMTGRIIDEIGSGLAGIYEAGREIILNLWNGAKAVFVEFIEWVKSIPSQITSAIGSIDLGNIIAWPEPPEWWTYLFGGDEPPAGAGSQGPSQGSGRPLQRRARGGPFGASPLLVGERGPELYFPNRTGYIANNGQLQRMNRLAQGVRAASLATLTATGALSLPAAAQSSAPAFSGRNVGDVHISKIEMSIPPSVTDPREVVEIFSNELRDVLDANFSD